MEKGIQLHQIVRYRGDEYKVVELCDDKQHVMAVYAGPDTPLGVEQIPIKVNINELM